MKYKKMFHDYIFNRFGIRIQIDSEQFDRFFSAWKHDILEETLRKKAMRKIDKI